MGRMPRRQRRYDRYWRSGGREFPEVKARVMITGRGICSASATADRLGPCLQDQVRSASETKVDNRELAAGARCRFPSSATPNNLRCGWTLTYPNGVVPHGIGWPRHARSSCRHSPARR